MIPTCPYCQADISSFNWGSGNPFPYETVTCTCGATVENPSLGFAELEKIDEKWRMDRCITENGVVRMLFSSLRNGGDGEATIKHRLYLDEAHMRVMIEEIKKHLKLPYNKNVKWEPWKYVKYCPLPK